ncbi:hypothetical protein [uncultured Methylobacterium sp.]|mgnify:CR=1 FL=1|uniref:hypothetical protein n=1 Tax=uncultured Methylobacterium sp. TaxID=157278 RepID=UPI0026267C92|nr:hypothetical protein [uncultured Methylobacterium sp.]
MSVIELVPVAEAAGFTVGCVAIHWARDWADTLTAFLAVTIVSLVLLIVVVAGLRQSGAPEDMVAAMAAASTAF